MSESNSKVTVLTVMAGAAGITLAFMWFKRNGIFSQKVYSPQLCISNNKDQHSLAHVDGASGGPALLLQARPVEVLEKLNALIACVSELKEEVRSLKEAIPRLNEHVCAEVFQKGVRKASPQHRGSRRKKAGTFRDDYMSSEDAESENGYVTAHTDTEDESDEGTIAAVKPFSEDDLLDKVDEFTFFIHKADNLHRGSEAEKKEGFMMLLEKKDQYGDKVPFLWRLARSYGDMFDSTTESEDKKNYAETALEPSTSAIPRSAGGEDDRGHPDGFRVRSRHFCHTRACLQRSAGKQLEPIRVPIKGAASQQSWRESGGRKTELERGQEAARRKAQRLQECGLGIGESVLEALGCVIAR
ncbi:RMD2 protein, partial [Polypterus senegalus]